MPGYADEVSNEEMSKASESLSVIGVDVYNEDGSFRELDVILGELAERWDDLTDAQQANISYNVAATRQSNKFKTILTAWKDAMDLATEATNTQGNALANQEKYAESYTGKLKSIKTEMDTFWLSFLDSGLTKGILDFFNGLAELLNKASEATSPMLTLSTVLGGLFFTIAKGKKIFNEFKKSDNNIFTSFKGKSASGIKKITNAFKVFTSTLSKSKNIFTAVGASAKSLWGSIGMFGKTSLVIGGVLALIKAFDLLTVSTKENEAAIDDIRSKYEELNSTAENNKKNVSSMADEYVELSKGVDYMGRNVSLTADEYARYQEICNEIAAMYPNLVVGFDAQGNAILNLKGNLQELNKEYEKQKVAAAREYVGGADKYKDDYKNKTKGNLWDKFWDFGEADVGGDISYTEAIEALNRLKNQTFEEFYNDSTDNKYFTKNNKSLSYLRVLGFDATMTKEEFDALKMTIPSEINSLNSVLQESISNIKQEGVSWLDIFFNDKSGEHYDTPDFVKQAMYNIANNMNEELISSLYDNDISIGSYIEDLLNSINSSPDARIALNNLVSIDEDFSLSRQKEIIDRNIKILSKELGRDENELKVSLGLDNFDNLNKDFNKLTKLSKDLFDIDTTSAKSAFEELSINTKEEIDLMIECVKNTDNLNEAIDEFNSKKINSEIEDRFATISESTTTLLDGISKVNDVLNSQEAGTSISMEDFNSEELKEYTSALEYQNGVYKLSKKAVKDLVKEKANEAIANTEAAKSLEQEQYVKNYEKIEKLRAELKNLSGDSKEAKLAEIDALMATNDIIASNCQNYDLLTASIRETIGVYNEWKNAQNASESGDMFDDTFNMIQAIRDVNYSDNESYMKTGTAKYQAAVDFLVPTDIDHEDMAAVAKYVGNLESYLLHDEDGKITGLNVQQFLDKSVKAELMSKDDDGNYQILGQKSMEDFASGLKLSLPMVQAIFGELEEYNFKFDWADEAKKSVNDFAMAGVQAANTLTELNTELDLVVNVSDLATAEEKTARLDETIKSMSEYQSTLNVNSEQYSLAADVINYCNMQKVALEQPAIMDIDTSKLEGQMQTVLSSLQELQSAKDTLEQLKVVGADTTEAEQNVNDLLLKVQELQKQDTQLFVDLGINDTSSIETIQESLKAITPEVMVKLGVPAEAIANFEKDTKVVVDVDDKATGKLEKIEEEISDIKEHSSTVLNVDANTSTAYIRLNSLQEKIEELQRNSNIKITTTEYKNTVYSSTVNGRKNNSFPANVNGTAHVSGNYTPPGGRAFVTGNAKLKGDWGTDIGERVLIGELGREIVVNPNDGTWRTYGDNGAEFAYIPKNAIIFNHLQSESLLKQGFVNSRATAAAKGTAFANGSVRVTGGGTWKPPKPQTNYPYKPTYVDNAQEFKHNTKAVDKNTEAIEKTSQKFDWIDRSLKYFSKKTEDIANRISEFINYDGKNNLINQQIESIKDQISANNSAYNGYLNEANAVGLSSSYKDKIINGTFRIEEIDTTDGANKGLVEQIQAFQDYYDKAVECSNAIVELNKQIAELAQSKFDNVTSKYDSKLSEISHMTSMVEKGLDIINAQGRFVSSNYYDSLINIENQNIALLKEEYNALTTAFSEAMNSGKIEEYSESWYDMKEQINSVQEALQDANLSLIEYKNQMREMEWSVFDKAQEYISNIADETNFLIDLLDNKDLFDDKGNMTNEGQAVAGLHAVNYNTYMAQSQEYAKEIEKINKEIAEDPYNTTLVDRRNELLKLQMESIKAAEGEKDSIIDLISSGYDKMLESLQKVIDKRKEALRAEKDMYDYEKSIAQKTEKITDYQKQLSALQGDNSEEAVSKKQQLENSLKEAQEDLKDTEYDKWISDQEKLLDTLYSDYEEFINLRLDDVNGLLSGIIDSTNENAGLIQDTIKENTNNVGYTISDAMDKIWSTSGNGIGKVVSDFSGNFTSSMTTVQSAVDSCKNYLSSILKQVKKETSSNTGGITNGNGSVTKPPTPPPSNGGGSSGGSSGSSSGSGSSGSSSGNKGSFFVHKKDYYPKHLLQINTSIVDRLKYHDFDSSFSQARKYYAAMGLGSASSYTGSYSQNINMISWMKRNGFSTGGTIGKAISASGEDGFILARSGEEVLSIPKLELASNMVNKLISSNTLLPNIKAVKPTETTGDIHFVVEEMNLPNVTDSKEFANEFVDVLKSNNNVQRAIRAVSTDLLTGKNSLSVKKIR